MPRASVRLLAASGGTELFVGRASLAVYDLVLVDDANVTNRHRLLRAGAMSFFDARLLCLLGGRRPAADVPGRRACTIVSPRRW